MIKVSSWEIVVIVVFYFTKTSYTDDRLPKCDRSSWDSNAFPNTSINYSADILINDKNVITLSLLRNKQPSSSSTEEFQSLSPKERFIFNVTQLHLSMKKHKENQLLFAIYPTEENNFLVKVKISEEILSYNCSQNGCIKNGKIQSHKDACTKILIALSLGMGSILIIAIGLLYLFYPMTKVKKKMEMEANYNKIQNSSLVLRTDGNENAREEQNEYEISNSLYIPFEDRTDEHEGIKDLKSSQEEEEEHIYEEENEGENLYEEPENITNK
ncbi:UNVERIFIED_CONTAM: hypothetical protein RMT77_001800 [Armadillidium vulgare]